MCETKVNGLVLNVERAFKLPGTQVSLLEKNGTDAQKWRFDPETGTIRSKLNDYCMDLEADRLVVNPYQEGKINQQWERKDKVIANRVETNMVLDIPDKDPKGRARVHPWSAHYEPNQCWTFELTQ